MNIILLWIRSFKLIDGSPCVVNVHVYSFFLHRVLVYLNYLTCQSVLDVFFFCGTDCMYGDKVLDCRVAECPTYAAAGVLDDCCETCRYYIVSTPTPRANSTALPSKKKFNSWHHGIHVITSLFGLVHWLHCYRTCEHSQKVHCVGKMVLWIVFVVSVGDTCCGRWWRWPVAYRHYHCCLLLLSQKSKRKGWIKISTWCGKDIMIFSYFL